MKWKIVQANWPAFVEPILQRWSATDEEEILAIDGDRARLTAYLAERHELTQAEAEEQIAEWMDGAVPADVEMDEHLDNRNITKSGAHIPPGEDVYSDDKDFGDDNLAASPVGRSD